MDETLPGGDDSAHGAGHVAAPATAGDRLRTAREAAGLSLADVAARTRVPQRQLEAVEQGRYTALPSTTYAIGFAKAYARAVGTDEVAIAAAVRDDIAHVGIRQREYEPYELPDAARIPSRGLVIAAAGVALAVLILLGLWYGTDLFRGDRSGPTAEPTVAAAPDVAPSAVATSVPPPAATPAAAVPTGGQVRLTANARVWLRVYDADDKTLYLGTMNEGDHFDVPADAKGPMVNIGRPDKLQVTLAGRPVPPLGASDHAIKDVKVDSASIAARLGAGGPAPAPSTSATSRAERRSDEGSRHAATRPRRHLDETQRANIESAAAPPAATGNSTR